MKKTKTVFRGRLLTLITDKRRLPNGHTLRLEIIKHPGAALIVPFLGKNKIILLKQYRPVVNSYIYELPAGTLNDGETPLACAKREVIEETGYSGRKFTKVRTIYPAPGYTTEKITIYKAEGLKKENVSPEKDEIIRGFVFSKTAVKKLLRTGRIVDAKTICALALCGWT